MDITRQGEVATRAASPDYFTGTVWQDPIVETPEGPPIMALKVTFAPGARTHWHSHPGGQTLHVLSGEGRVQARGGPLRRIGPGDTVWIPPGQEHWHGAAPHHAMTHLAIQAVVDGSAVTWLEPVKDAEYAADPG